jgi:hypothetical protein
VRRIQGKELVMTRVQLVAFSVRSTKTAKAKANRAKNRSMLKMRIFVAEPANPFLLPNPRLLRKSMIDRRFMIPV